MKYEYHIKLRADAGAIAPEIKKFMDSVNDTMKEFGFKDHIVASIPLPEVIMTVNMELNAEQKAECSKIVLEGLQKRMPTYNILLDSMKLARTYE